MGNMTHRVLTGTGDWLFGHGLSNLAVDEEAIKYNIATRLREWKGNCFFNLDAGIDWQSRLDKNQKDNLIADISLMLSQIYGVTKVNSVDFSYDAKTRDIVISYNVDTIFSPNFEYKVALTTRLLD